MERRGPDYTFSFGGFAMELLESRFDITCLGGGI
jgi:hypothetical protein